MRTILLFLALFIMNIFISCTSDQQDMATEEKKLPLFENLKGLTIGLSMKTLTDIYFVARVNAAKRKAKEFGLNFVSIDAQDDMVKQLAIHLWGIQKRIN